MLPTVLRTPPVLADYITLEDYQSRTPDVFAPSRPVLHFHAAAATVAIPRSQCGGSLPMFPTPPDSHAPDTPNPPDDDLAAEEMVERTMDVFVGTDALVLFCLETESGLSIPYPAVGFHATQKLHAGAGPLAVVMQLELWDAAGDDDSGDPVDLTIVPADPAPAAATRLYAAVAACSSLHPDPVDQSDSDGDDDRILFESGMRAVDGLPGAWHLPGPDAAHHPLPPPAPGSTGWITADNVHEYFDDAGNWIRDRDPADPQSLHLHDPDRPSDLSDPSDPSVAPFAPITGRVRLHNELDLDSPPVRPLGQDDVESKRPRME